MKKHILLLIIITGMTLISAGCGQNIPAPGSDGPSEPNAAESGAVMGAEKFLHDRRPMVMVKGELYYDTGRESDIDARCGVMDGEIISTVDGTEIPTEDNQSNFGSGYEYQFVDENNIDIVINQKWIRFKKETGGVEASSEDRWGIQFSASDITASGLTLICSQSGGQPTGDLQTGSPYWVEVWIDNQWVPVEMLPSEYERAWTAEAYIIPMNDSTEWVVNWVWLYGELSAGNYRIGKEVMDFRGSGDYDTNTYYANFEIMN